MRLRGYLAPKCGKMKLFIPNLSDASPGVESVGARSALILLMKKGVLQLCGGISSATRAQCWWGAKMRAIVAVLGGLCMIGLWILGVIIYFFTLYLAYLTSFVAILLTFFFPFIGQLYWLWAYWNATGVFLNELTMLCIGWLALAAIGVTFSALAQA